MLAQSPFDGLVAELSADERVALLERIRLTAQVSDEPLYQAATAAAPRPGARAEDLGLVAKLVLFLRALFSGKSRDELLREDGLKEIGRGIELRYPGLIDRRRGLIFGAVAEELRGLRDSARFFYDALDRSVERDRPAFYAFLASIELPETHERLAKDSDPAAVAATLSELRGSVDDLAVRGAAIAAFELAFSDLSDKGRRAMYQDLRSVLFLKRLSGFLFERLLGTFHEAPTPEAQAYASFYDARDLLLELGDILFSMAEPPSASVMEAIFVFAEREALGKEGGDPASLVGADIAKAQSALARIRAFNARVPLAELLRLVSGDPEYQPRELPGGEDWLAVYKAFWKERIDASLESWRAEHRNKELVAEIDAFVGEPGPAGFAHISREESELSPPLNLDLALVFLDAFYRGPFLRELNRPLKIVLVDGEFYRKDNRLEYTDAYDGLLHIPDFLASLDSRLGPEGEIGRAWIGARQELGTAAAKRRRLQTIARGAEEEAERIIRREGSALHTMTLILKGFLKGEAGGRYDSLANISYLDGKSNKDFLKSLSLAMDRCERGLGLLSELSGLDLARAD
jgi:hypothetical protein